MQVTSDINYFADYLRSISCLTGIQRQSLAPYLPDIERFSNHCITEKCGLSISQTRFLRSMHPRKEMIAIKGNFCQFTFVNGTSDSKDIFISPDLQLIYDAKPHWLPQYIELIKQIDISNPLSRNHIKNVCVPGGLLSFSHFVGRNLAPFILFGSSVSLPFFLPIYRDWQRSLVDLYSPTVNPIGLKRTSQIGEQMYFCSFQDSWLFEELLDWESLLVARGQLRFIVPRLEKTRHLVGDKQISSKIYLSRLRYETLTSQLPRTANWPEIFDVLNKRSFNMVFPESISFLDVLHKLYNSSVIVCDSGSAFINYVLFASPLTRIIQLTPNGALQNGTSFNLLSPMQWYRPVIEQITFLPSIRNASHLNNGEFSWNLPSRYDAARLVELLGPIE